jgi:hypothetical protein
MMLIEKVGDMQTLLYFLNKKNPKLCYFVVDNWLSRNVGTNLFKYLLQPKL